MPGIILGLEEIRGMKKVTSEQVIKKKNVSDCCGTIEKGFSLGNEDGECQTSHLCIPVDTERLRWTVIPFTELANKRGKIDFTGY